MSVRANEELSNLQSLETRLSAFQRESAEALALVRSLIGRTGRLWEEPANAAGDPPSPLVDEAFLRALREDDELLDAMDRISASVETHHQRWGRILATLEADRLPDKVAGH
ncbi:hypothetical protein [Acuticoccus mangrovi]|uniref:Uncharacterized protein n=1 Tax=Acuticoccus mangrovi TaxID=2796142 RepID=A0A934IRL5_9HYPH|nr:hypothetical protein [Acuticoccus mangrovi]MBJ3778817.1 hypothetical protein [Acuticoccus mangrovi]